MNTPQEFTIDVPGIGAFTFARRTMRAEFRIQAEFSRLTEGVETPTPELTFMGGVFSQLKVLTVKAPDGWNLDDMDPLVDADWQRMVAVHRALREKEGSFRPGAKAAGAGSGPANSGQPGVLVPAPVQPGADRPAVP